MNKTAKNLYELDSFKKQYEAILNLSVYAEVPIEKNESELKTIVKEIDWNNCLSIASFLAFSEESYHQKAALRIAQASIIYNKNNPAILSSAAYVLNCLTNYVAVDLAMRRDYISPDIYKSFSILQNLERLKGLMDNQISIFSKDYFLNKTQSEVYKYFLENYSISLSAPTSAGKSFIILATIFKEIENLISKNRHSRDIYEILIIVPTRALINQTRKSIERSIVEFEKFTDIQIETFPESEIQKNKRVIISIFTQERLHWELKENSSFKPNIVVIDEAQKISEANRGLLLERTLRTILDRNPEARMIFASPFSRNPEIFLNKLSIGQKKSVVVKTFFAAVSQNLLWITPTMGNSCRWNVRLFCEEFSIDLGEVHLNYKPETDKKKLAYIAYEFHKTGPTLIYSNGASDAEKIAEILVNLKSDADKNNLMLPPEITDAIDFISKAIHPNYALVRTLKYGIAFHYGNMPEKVREVVEDLFSSGKIEMLVCTSTLLEGVNLPAKNLVMYKPCRGRNNPLSSNDFWNLAGRAGRWGKEFTGNVVLISPNDWKEQIELTKKNIKPIEFASDQNLSGDEKFINFLQNEGPLKDSNNSREAFSNFLFYDIDHLSKFKLPLDLNKQLIKFYDDLPFPPDLLNRNPGVSPFAMVRLWDYFNENSINLRELLPPDISSGNVYFPLVTLIENMYTCLQSNSRAGKRAKYLAILILNWTRGLPLREIIAKALKHEKENGLNKSLQTVIRDLLNDINNFVRFEFLRDINCYCEVLKAFYIAKDQIELVDQVPDFSKSLELGVGTITQASLLSLGFSRTSAIEISSFWPNVQMTRAECLSYLENWDIDKVDLPVIIKKEIKKIINKGNPSNFVSNLNS